MSDLIDRLRMVGGVCDEAADEIERLQRENEELRADKDAFYKVAMKKIEELAALKASTEPVYLDMWIEGDSTCYWHEITKREYDKLPEDYRWLLYTTPPTATALVEDFRKRAVEVCKQHEFGSAVAAIESLPLIGKKE